MRADKISLEAKSDDLICAFGARYLSTHREKHFVTLTSRKMRELSKVLLEIKKINPEVKCLFHALNPTNFDLFVQATQIVARYDPTKEKFEAPTFAMNIVNSLKQCCDIAINFVLRGRHRSAAIPNAEAEVRFRTMIHLFQANWRFEVSSVAASNLNLNKWNKTTIFPLASDLKLLMIYLLDIAKQNIEKLQTDTRDATAYNNLVETIFCRVILLNRRRPGELQRMLLDIYMNCGNDKEQYQEFENIITKSERVLLRSLKRVVIRGKRSRGVPVLFSNDVQEHIKIMLKNRSKFVPADNVYLFAKAGCSNEISGYKTLKKHADKCGAKNPNALTSTRLRKHLATLTQIFNMSDNDIEQLASFMGHTVGIHRGSYRLPDDVYQTAKLSKLLLLMERGQAGDYKGKSLEEIELDMEKDLLEEPNGAEESDVENGSDIESEILFGGADVNVPNNTYTSPGSKKKKRILIPWTPEEKKLAKQYFKGHIRCSKPPKRHECQQLIDENPDIFKNRDWLKIKVFIQNQYTKKKAEYDSDD
nr:unnamed protein product [Callosobruchus analis]